MPEKITNYKVFIASPGGLEQERKIFKETIHTYNEEIIHLGRNVSFTPMGWEDTLPGFGRPQSLINNDIIKCDYFVMLLWDRWGSLPGIPDECEYSSACEEELDIAVSCMIDVDKPMRQVVIFFKAVNHRQLADPGEQLSKVLDFKIKIEAEKKHFFCTFDDIFLFQKDLRCHLASWLKIHEIENLSTTTP